MWIHSDSPAELDDLQKFAADLLLWFILTKTDINSAGLINTVYPQNMWAPGGPAPALNVHDHHLLASDTNSSVLFEVDFI